MWHSVKSSAVHRRVTSDDHTPDLHPTSTVGRRRVKIGCVIIRGDSPCTAEDLTECHTCAGYPSGGLARSTQNRASRWWADPQSMRARARVERICRTDECPGVAKCSDMRDIGGLGRPPGGGTVRARKRRHADAQKILRLETAGTGRRCRLFVGCLSSAGEQWPRQLGSRSGDRGAARLVRSAAVARIAGRLGRRATGGAGAAANRDGGAIARAALRTQKAAGRRPDPAVCLGGRFAANQLGPSRAAGQAASAG